METEGGTWVSGWVRGEAGGWVAGSVGAWTDDHDACVASRRDAPMGSAIG